MKRGLYFCLFLNGIHSELTETYVVLQIYLKMNTYLYLRVVRPLSPISDDFQWFPDQ